MHFSPDPKRDAPDATGVMTHYWSISGETRFLNKRDMESKGQKVEYVSGDGNCLISSFCALYNKTTSGWLPEMRARVENLAGEFRIPIPLRLDVPTLRRLLSEYLRKHWNHYWAEEMFRNEMIEEMNSHGRITRQEPYQTDDEYKSLMRERYTQHVLGDKMWARAPEIDAGAEIFGARVLVFINQHLDPKWLAQGVNLPDSSKMYESPLALVYTPTNPPSYTQEWLIYHESMVHYQYVTPVPTVDGPGGSSFLGGPPPPGPPPSAPPPSAPPAAPTQKPSIEDMEKAMEQIAIDAAKASKEALVRRRDQEAARKKAEADQAEQLRQIRLARAKRFEASKSPPAPPTPAPAPAPAPAKPVKSAAAQQKERIAALLAERQPEMDEDLQRVEEERAETRRRQAEQDAYLAALEALSSSGSGGAEKEANALMAKLKKEEEDARAQVESLKELQRQMQMERPPVVEEEEDDETRFMRMLSKVDELTFDKLTGGSGGGGGSGGSSSNKTTYDDDDGDLWDPLQ